MELLYSPQYSTETLKLSLILHINQCNDTEGPAAKPICATLRTAECQPWFYW